MEELDRLVQALDPVLILPYRLFGDPHLAWWTGTLILAATAVLVGELTVRLARRINRAYLDRLDADSLKLQDQSLAALKAGDKPAYKSINKLANEAFGRNFFAQAALGIASLWPAFLVAGWLQARFGHLRWELPLLGWPVNFVPGFILCYLAVRIGWWRLKKKLLPQT